jgi:OLD-like protein
VRLQRSSAVNEFRDTRADELPAGGPAATSRALARASDARAIVLVEGFSDQIALEALAGRLGRDLAAEGIAIVPIGGAQAIRHFLLRFGPMGSKRTLAGLCDVGEEAVFQQSLELAGFGSHLSRADMEELGFHVCDADLEDELIRALGATRVEAVIDSEGDLGSFRTFQKQPAWRGREIEAQLRRFLGSADRRKLRYARLLVEALDLADVPRPLARVLARV